MSKFFSQHFRCPEELINFGFPESHPGNRGFFRFGNGALCYGKCSGGETKPQPGGDLYDASAEVRIGDGAVSLPFSPAEIIDNLRFERYADTPRHPVKKIQDSVWVRNLYYIVRPALPVAVRKHFQRLYLAGWDEIPFPHWPLDSTVEELFEKLLLLSMKSSGIDKIPFIWFWPEGAPGCVMLTHDVEGASGRDFCSQLMDIDDSFRFKSSFQVVPEKRYEVPRSYLGEIRDRGFEINIHDLNHDGHLFSSKEEFLRRAVRINEYAAEFGSRGFRSAVLYRNLEWYGALRFSYDMSVPNVGNLDYQRGGCCTVMPYFIGDILELPLTTIQDYGLFYILNDYSLDLWKQQIDLIRARHGLASFNIHPDYLITSKARNAYRSLLEHLASLREKENWWVARPGEIDRWWRDRNEMRVVRGGQNWRIEGSGKERARLAYVRAVGDQLEYVVDRSPGSNTLAEIGMLK